jgi:hypothetical protein
LAIFIFWNIHFPNLINSVVLQTQRHPLPVLKFVLGFFAAGSCKSSLMCF